MIAQIVDLILYEADNRKGVDLPANIISVEVDIMLILMQVMFDYRKEIKWLTEEDNHQQD